MPKGLVRTFRYAEFTRGYGGQVQQALIAANSGAVSGVVTIPVHGGVTSGKIVILTEDGAIRWDITFSANNAATYVTRATGTVPSATPPARRVWCELLQLGSVTQTKPA